MHPGVRVTQDGGNDVVFIHCAKVRAVDRDNAVIGVLSTGEQCAVCLLLDRPDIAKQVYGTMLEGAVRVGPEWLAAALYVQTNGWTETAGGDD